MINTIQIGKLYVVGLVSSVSYLIFSTRSYTKYNELSELGVINESSLFFNLTNIINGILLFFYFSRYMTISRHLVSDIDLTIKFGKISALGQIGLGLLPNSDKLHYFHLLSAIIFFFIATLSILNYSMVISKTEHLYIFRGLSNFGYVIFAYAIAYPLILRPMPLSKGIWQIIFTTLILSWYIIEEITYQKYKEHININSS